MLRVNHTLLRLDLSGILGLVAERYFLSRVPEVRTVLTTVMGEAV
jgi:hypothetical protein